MKFVAPQCERGVEVRGTVEAAPDTAAAGLGRAHRGQDSASTGNSPMQAVQSGSGPVRAPQSRQSSPAQARRF